MAALARARAAVHRHRGSFLAFALLLFVGGAAWSASKLQLGTTQLNIWPAVILFCVMTPLGLLYGAAGLLQLASIGGHRISFFDAWRSAGYAQLAEALPLPGGAIVRSAALVQAGSTVGRSVVLVGAAAVLWVALSASVAGLVLYQWDPLLGGSMATFAMLVTIGVVQWIARQAGLRIAAGVLVHRLIGLVLMSARMFLAFLVIGEVLQLSTTFYFAFSNIAGSAAAIAPAGLGIGEAIAAAMATLVEIPPEVAFLAVAINRIISITSCGIVVAISHYLTTKITRSRSGVYS